MSAIPIDTAHLRRLYGPTVGQATASNAVIALCEAHEADQQKIAALVEALELDDSIQRGYKAATKAARKAGFKGKTTGGAVTLFIRQKRAEALALAKGGAS